MSPNNILGFLLPQFGDPLQLTFFLIIFVMVGATIVGAHRTARPDSWERKWHRGTPDDHLDIEHGSVTDLWHAVATAPEKLAEIMPGLLLVVGLLGTFLGLGLALNNASSILGHANLADPGAAADSMQNLLGMLQGLGTKFKTSTWGILSFVLLKIWSEATRFEEKRLAWVIGKAKGELEQRKRTESQAQQARQEALILQIGGVARHIVDGFGQHLAGLGKSNEALHLQQMAQMAKIEQATDGVRHEVVQVQAGTEIMCTAMNSFTESTKEVVGNMDDAAQRMAAGADKVGAGASELVEAIGNFQNQFKTVLDDVRRDLSGAINNMSEQAAVTLKEGSGQLKEATTDISRALTALSADVKGTMSAVDVSIKEALKIQKNASLKFIESNETLNENMAATTGIIEKLAEPIRSGLTAVSTSNRQIGGVAKAVESSTDSLTKVVQAMHGLPDALLPLKDMTEEHRSLIALLRPLGETVKVQQAMLALLEEIQRDRTNPQPPAGTTFIKPDAGSSVTAV